jgi:DNA-binding beta-propeller fold protein YncE
VGGRGQSVKLGTGREGAFAYPGAIAYDPGSRQLYVLASWEGVVVKVD